MKIVKLSEDLYEITDGEQKIPFSKEKYEDMYYAVPLNQTSFLRLLLDNVCQSDEQRHMLSAMLDNTGDRYLMLEQLQKQIQDIGYDEE